MMFFYEETEMRLIAEIAGASIKYLSVLSVLVMSITAVESRPSSRLAADVVSNPGLSSSSAPGRVVDSILICEHKDKKEEFQPYAPVVNGVALPASASAPAPTQSSGTQGAYQSQTDASILPAGAVLVSTTNDVPGYRTVSYKGIVRGDVVIEPTIVQSFKASFKSIVGGKIGAYSRMCQRARSDAFDDMLAQARQLGANAVVGLSYDSSTFSTSNANDVGTEVFCCGTAVMVEPLR